MPKAKPGVSVRLYWTAAFLIMIIGLWAFPRIFLGGSSPQPDVYISSKVVAQGDLSLIRVIVKKGQTPQVTWMKKEVYLVPNHQKTDWIGFLGADLATRPGRYRVQVKIPNPDHEKHIEIEIIKKDYGVRRLTLPKNMVDLDKETIRRVKKESAIMKNLLEAPPSAPLWNGPFLRPVIGKVIGPFGQRSIINNQPRSPHSGLDLKAERGSPIKAVNRGSVVLAGDHFFSGMSVVIDHGGGIQSMYFHLDRILVQVGQVVAKGDIIGLVGSTGRATGPHLHWGMRINGARIDPLQLILLSRQLEE